MPAGDATARAQSPVPGTSGAVPSTEPREEVVATPPIQMPPAGTVLSMMVLGEERDWLMDRLNEFRKCIPQIFDGEKADHWIVEKWLMHMENLFHNTFVEEHDRVWLATHLDGETYRWWADIRDDPNTDPATITWKRLKKLLLSTYFSQSVKRQMERNLHSLCQGDRTVGEYEREFSRLLHYVLFVVRDDEDKAHIFDVGLRPSIFRLVQHRIYLHTQKW